jgi:hypothetical protein
MRLEPSCQRCAPGPSASSSPVEVLRSAMIVSLVAARFAGSSGDITHVGPDSG